MTYFFLKLKFRKKTIVQHIDNDLVYKFDNRSIYSNIEITISHDENSERKFPILYYHLVTRIQ